MLAVALACCSAAFGASPLPLTVRTASGPVTGVIADTVQSFKGIPFALPPVGELRWRAPQPVKPWREPLLADHHGHDCAQIPFPSDAAPLGTEPSEDCLVLNVWRPAAASPVKRPVIVWIYGGGFVNGGASPAVYDGSEAARHDVVFVSFNYRLGRFGFFAHPALTAAAPKGEALGNYAYMDQLAALRWVQRNIAAFGGDPRNVTLVGESAGGGSVHMLLTAKQARGLFHRAVIQSGGGRGSLLGPRHIDQDRPGSPSAQTIGVNFAQANGISGTGAEALAALRALPADKIVAGMNMASMRPADPAKPTYSGPMQDGQIVTADPDVQYRRGDFNKVDVMVGANSADLGFAAADTKEALWASFGASANQARAAYDPSGTAALPALLRQVGRDRSMLEPARHVARLLALQGQKAYLYRFSYVATSMRDEWKDGAPHASDIPFFFNTVAAKYGAALSGQDAAAGRAILEHLVAFSRTGKPDGGLARRWPAYDPAQDGLMDLAQTGEPHWSTDPLKAQLDAVAAAADAAH